MQMQNDGAFWLVQACAEEPNSYKVEQSVKEDCAEIYGHLTVFNQGRLPLNKEGNSEADYTLCPYLVMQLDFPLNISKF